MKPLSAGEILDGPLYFLGRSHPSVLDLALVTVPGGKAALIFSSEALARAHLSSVPEGVEVLRAGDLRAKEEVLRAALARDAITLWFDAPVQGGGSPRAAYPLQRALEYTLSYKRQSACL